jgi:bifunctional DNase/RNase
VDINEENYNGTCVIISRISDPSFMLFFPISKENAKIINYVLKEDSKYDVNTNILGIYKTMIDSWKAGDKYLSGIIMDTNYNHELKDEVLVIRLALADSDGHLDSLVHVNFLHSVLLAAMEGVDIVVSDKLIEKMIPEEDEKMNSLQNCSIQHFPEDKKIVDIARKIMNGKIKEI